MSLFVSSIYSLSVEQYVRAKKREHLEISSLYLYEEMNHFYGGGN